MEWLDEGVVISQRRHGESAAIVSLFTSIHGRHAGLARGAKGVRSRGVYQQGNQVTVSWRARLSEHLGTFNCELKDARAARIINNPLQLAALSSVCALIEVGLPERHPYPDLYHSTIDLMDLFDDDDTWPRKLVFWELQLLAELMEQK